jgi:F420-non-reducing hydrogenase iron-sulfur subunit
MCSGRIDLEFILRAFLKGQDGVLIGGCKLNECNYVTHGNFDALSNTYLFKKIMKKIGLNPERLRIEFMSGADGNLLAEVINDFVKKVKGLGPIGKGEGIAPKGLRFKLEAARKLVPYIKLVERERMRVPVKSKEAYHHFFNGDEADRLFDELIGDKLSISQILSLLREKPLSTGNISEMLGLSPSEVSRHMNISSRHGFVRYDEGKKCYTLA